MLSDYDASTASFAASGYDISIGSTVKLTFTTSGAIHRLTDSGNSPIPGEHGSGLKGTSDFLYYGNPHQDTLVFRSAREVDDGEYTEVKFTRATAATQGEIGANLVRWIV